MEACRAFRRCLYYVPQSPRTIRRLSELSFGAPRVRAYGPAPSRHRCVTVAFLYGLGRVTDSAHYSPSSARCLGASHLHALLGRDKIRGGLAGNNYPESGGARTPGGGPGRRGSTNAPRTTRWKNLGSKRRISGCVQLGASSRGRASRLDYSESALGWPTDVTLNVHAATWVSNTDLRTLSTPHGLPTNEAHQCISRSSGMGG